MPAVWKMHSIHVRGLPSAPLCYSGQELPQVLSQLGCVYVAVLFSKFTFVFGYLCFFIQEYLTRSLFLFIYLTFLPLTFKCTPFMCEACQVPLCVILVRSYSMCCYSLSAFIVLIKYRYMYLGNWFLYMVCSNNLYNCSNNIALKSSILPVLLHNALFIKMIVYLKLFYVNSPNQFYVFLKCLMHIFYIDKFEVDICENFVFSKICWKTKTFSFFLGGLLHFSPIYLVTMAILHT